MSDDRTLLELAAKAAGIVGIMRDNGIEIREDVSPPYDWKAWNPLVDDGDAFRLMVKLQLLIDICSAHVSITWVDEALSSVDALDQWDNGMTPEEMTRHAIVRAAASIGEGNGQG